jgi:hypothetical protein
MRIRFVAGRWMDEADFTPMGAPESSVEMPGDLILGLRIPHPFGKGTDAILQIHATEVPDEPGGIITLAIGAVVSMDVNLQSNPHRADDEPA